MSTLKVGTIQDHTNSTTAMTIDDAGRILTPARPAWRLQLNSSQSISGSLAGIVAWDNSSTNGNFIQGGCTLSSGAITVPISGIYQINCSTRFESVGGAYIEQYMRVNGNGSHRAYHITGDPLDNYHSVSMGHLFKLAANDVFDIQVNTQTDTDYSIAGGQLSTFSGHLVG
tara:strand:- start:39 stop:551 length:513 start_codon:yes stop_codon:yes gene_type:complete